MENLPISDFNFFLFIIPGFMMVWCFKKLTGREVKGDFELLGLSAFLGLVNLVILNSISKADNFAKLSQNVFAATIVSSVLSISLSYVLAWVVLQDEWQKLKKIFKPRKTKFPFS